MAPIIPPPREASWDLPCDPEAVAKARALAREALADWNLTAAAEDVELIVSELVTNAVVHARPPIGLTLYARGAAVRGEVVDHSTAVPRPVMVTLDEEYGRGLALVEAYATRWGVDPLPTGKVVWFVWSRS
ncbi:ATP-binding protein [Nonomuraea pusilla]|uniref:ATP-binding protein n=1 Tax=Nonomuraea pusilla TaxID=46177 RepID=UPI003423F707